MIHETYKGCKIKITKGRYYGYSRVVLNGVDLGNYMEDQDKALASIKGTIDFAHEVGVGSGRFTPEWYAPGTYELCDEGHAKPIDGACGHHWCVKQRDVVAEETPTAVPELRITHVRKQINPRRVRGNSFYAVQLGAAENGSQTLCGEPAGIDLSYAEIARRRSDFDWTAFFASLPKVDVMSGMVMCAGCLAQALELKEQRAQPKRRQPRRIAA